MGYTPLICICVTRSFMTQGPRCDGTLTNTGMDKSFFTRL